MANTNTNNANQVSANGTYKAGLGGMPDAPDHPMLAALMTQMSGQQIVKTVEVFGVKYELSTLWPYEEAWADSLVEGMSAYQTARNRRFPYLAASIRSINGVTVREMFRLPDDTPEGVRRALEETPEAMTGWRRLQLYRRLAGAPPLLVPPAVAALWVEYNGLEDMRAASLEKLAPFSMTDAGLAAASAPSQSGGASSRM